ncbi:hypothetical protein HK096_004758 [Nowakowskiella sp. JEL0078]|nr:hypothetical protein HK096_004758 [Nowakowskiella sp. JEL0078]
MSKGFISNPFETREDVVDGLRALLDPLAKVASPGGARIKIGNIATHYDEVAAQLEGFSRPLWGLASLLDSGDYYEYTKVWTSGFENGSDPSHDEFWGYSRDKDQRMVEMSPIGFALATAPKAFWEPLSETGKKNLITWLAAINQKEMPDTNWLWFRVFANLGLRKVGAPTWDADRMKKDLNHLDTFYLDGGWSRDGPEGVVQFDYYSSSFAIHVAQLLYAKLAGNEDPERAKEYVHRAQLFAVIASPLEEV